MKRLVDFKYILVMGAVALFSAGNAYGQFTGEIASKFFAKALGTDSEKLISEALEKFGLKPGTYISEDMGRVFSDVLSKAKAIGGEDLSKLIGEIPNVKMDVFSNLNTVKDFKGFGEFDKIASDQVGLGDAFEKNPYKAVSYYKDPNISIVEPEPLNKEIGEFANKVDQAKDGLARAEKNLKDAKQLLPEKNVKQYEAVVKKANNELDVANKNYDNSLDTFSKQTETKIEEIDSKIATTNDPQQANALKNDSNKLGQEKKVAEAKLEKAQRTELQEKIDKAQQTLKDLDSEKKDLSEKVKTAKDQELADAQARLKEIDGEIENAQILIAESSEKMEAIATDLPTKAWWKTKEALGAFAISGGIVGFGYSAAMWALNEFVWEPYKNSKVAAAMKKPQHWGNIWMVLPSQFVKTDNIDESLFLYAGLNYQGSKPEGDVALVTQLDAQRKYFSEDVEKNKKPVAITAATFSGKMLSFSTGDIFVSSGQAADITKPTLPIVTSSATEKSLREELENIAGFVAEDSQQLASLMLAKNNNKEFSPGGNYPAMANVSDSQYPALLNASIAHAIDKPVSFVNRAGKTKFTAQQIVGLNKVQLQAMMGTAPDTFKDGTYPFGVLGTYVYQTQDTDLAREMKFMPGGVLFNDYVVFLDGNFKQIPLYAPKQTGLYHFFSYDRNDEIVYMKSLLDDAIYQAKSKIDQASTTAASMGEKLDDSIAQVHADVGTVTGKNVWEGDLALQIKAVRAYVEKTYKEGQYHIGTQVLSSVAGWADQGIYIYQIKNALAGGTVDDYVFGLKQIDPNNPKKLGIAKLPQDRDVVYQYFSIVTSHCYDPHMVPYKSPAHRQINYGIGTDGKLHYGIVGDAISQKQLIDDEKKVPGGKYKLKGVTEQYTMYMDADINPIDMSTLGDALVNARVQIAYNMMLPAFAGSQSPMVTSDDVRQRINGDPNAGTNGAWKDWKQFFKANIFNSQTRTAKTGYEVTTYAFYNIGVNNAANIYITASNQTDIAKKLYVYGSKDYPSEYLVPLTTWNKTTKASALNFKMSQFVNEQYLVSITTGNVYDGKNMGTTVFTYDPQDVWNALVAKYKSQNIDLNPTTWPTTTVQTIVDAIKRAEIVERTKECSTSWGSFRLYLNNLDNATHQYIYGDISGLSSNQYMLATKEELENKLISEWFVCGEYVLDNAGKPQKNNDGSYQYTYGKKFNADTTKILMSLSSSTGYNNNREAVMWNAGKITAQMTNRAITEADVNTNFTMLIGQAAQVSGISASSLRLYSQLLDKKARYLNTLRQENAEIAEAKRELEKRTPPLDVTVQELLALPIVPNTPGMLPRNLRKAANGKYYQITPENPKDTDVIYITTYNATTDSTDSGRGYVYEIAPGTPSARKAERDHGFELIGEGLNLVRAHAGVMVASDGKQTLGIGFESPNISVDHMLLLDAKNISDYQTKLTEAITKRDALTETMSEGKRLTDVQQKELADARAQVKTYKTAINASQVLKEASDAKLLKFTIKSAGGIYAQATATIDSIWLDAATMAYVAKIKDGNDAYYLDLSSGFAYDISTGRARVRPLLIGAPNKVMNQVLVNTKDKTNLALLITDAVGLKQFVFQNPGIQGSIAAAMSQVADQTVQQSNVYYNEYHMFASVSNPDSGPVSVSVNVKESPVDKVAQDNYQPNANTVYTVSEKILGSDTFTDIATYKYDSSQYFGPLYYYTTRTSGNDLGFVDADVKKVNPVAYIWNGDEKRVFTDILYEHQIVPLTSSGAGVYTGTVYGIRAETTPDGDYRLVTDPTKTRQISVKQVAKKLPADLTEDIVTITDGVNEYDFHYATELIADIAGFVRDVVRLTPITDVNGVTSLAYVIDKNMLGAPVTTAQNTNNTPQDVVTRVNGILAKAGIIKTTNNKHLLYVIQPKDLAYGKFAGFKVDLASGIVYNAFGVPFAGLDMIELLGILDTLGVRVMMNDQNQPYLVYHGI